MPIRSDIHLDPNPDREADTLAAYLCDPAKPPDIRSMQDSELPYVLRSLLRRAQVLEAWWFRLVAESTQAKTASERATLTRQAATVNASLQTVLSAVYKVQRDQSAGALAPTESTLIDAPIERGRLTTRQRVEAEAAADAVFEGEFRQIAYPAGQPERWGDGGAVALRPAASAPAHAHAIERGNQQSTIESGNPQPAAASSNPQADAGPPPLEQVPDGPPAEAAEGFSHFPSHDTSNP